MKKTLEQNLSGSIIKINLDYWNYDPQHRILRAVIENDGKKLSLRDYCKLAEFKGSFPAKAKHHLERLLVKGMIVVSEGIYRVSPELNKHLTIYPENEKNNSKK